MTTVHACNPDILCLHWELCDNAVNASLFVGWFYSVSQTPLWNFVTFFPNGWEFLVQILHAYYTFQSKLDYKFLFNYLQLKRSYAILSATSVLKMSTIDQNTCWVVALNMA